jgi:type IV pilus assembly protein PilB
MSEFDYIPLSLDLQQLLTTEQAWHYAIVPKQADAGGISLYIDESRYDENIVHELEILLGRSISLEKASPVLISKTLGKYYRKNLNTGQSFTLSSTVKSSDFLQQLILEARHLGSSDIHIEAYEEKCRIRFRIDGLLVERFNITKAEYPPLINKIKIKANLDIAEKRLPQDGRILFSHDGIKFDIRVSVLPVLHGEKIVLRLLSNDSTNIDIEELGFTSAELETYMEGIRKPHGIVLISGPTGSGKTTTLYGTLKVLNKTTDNILTVEDPIEYTLEGINQVQLKESIGLTFASALRTFLRQDPDIIMVGEIRDGETAEIAVRAALTGHLVLSTIHTNSAWGTISRLIDMGVPSFLVASTLNTSVAQRLVRLLCKECRKEESFSDKLFPKGFVPPLKITKHFVPAGCPSCYYTGYRGRKAVYEIIPIDHELAEYIKSNRFEIGDVLKKKKISTLGDNAFTLFREGETSIEEIYPLLIIN